MSVELVQTLLQASGAAGVTLMFVWYLIKRDKRDGEMVDKFNKTIEGHLERGLKVQAELATRLQEFKDANRELKDVIEKMYIQNLKLVKAKNKI